VARRQIARAAERLAREVPAPRAVERHGVVVQRLDVVGPRQQHALEADGRVVVVAQAEVLVGELEDGVGGAGLVAHLVAHEGEPRRHDVLVRVSLVLGVEMPTFHAAWERASSPRRVENKDY